MLLNNIIKLLGKPYFQTENCLIYRRDCLEAMAALPDNLINLTVTSPPYNIGKDYEKSLPLEEYLRGASHICKYTQKSTIFVSC